MNLNSLKKAVMLGSLCTLPLCRGENFAQILKNAPKDEDFLYSNRTETPLPYPLPPRGVAVMTADAKSVTLAWRPPFDSRDIAAYRIYRDFKLVAECSRNSRAWRDKNIKSGETYRYFVRSVNSAGRMSGIPGIYAYNGYQKKDNIDMWKKILGKPYISGATVSFFWKDLEPEEGKFDWKYLDDLIAVAAAQGKTVGLWPYLPAPWLPDRMKGKIKTYTTANTRTKTNIPYALDPVMIEAYNRHVMAIAKRYNGNPNVSYMIVTLSGTSGMHNNVQPAPAQFELLSKKFGYTVAAHIKAWQDQFKFYEKILPDTRWGYDIHYTNDELGPALAVADWALKKYGSKVILFNEGLNGLPWMRLQWKLNGWQLNSEYIADQKNRTSIGYQMLGQSCSSKGPDTGSNGPLKQALKNGLDYDADFMEVWVHDVCRDEYASLFEKAAARMGIVKVTIPGKR